MRNRQPFCTPAIWQQRPTSNFIRTLECRGHDLPQCPFTVIFVNLRRVIQPSMNGESQRLPAGPNVTNIRIQDFCGAGFQSADHATVVDNPVGDGDDLEECSRTARKAAQSPDRESPRHVAGSDRNWRKSQATRSELLPATFTQTIPNTVVCRLSLRFAATRGPGRDANADVRWT